MAQAVLAFETPPEEIEYPESDGEPMAETDEHRDDLAEIVFTLKRFFRGRSDVYVSGNLFVYSEEGNPQAFDAIDVARPLALERLELAVQLPSILLLDARHLHDAPLRGVVLRPDQVFEQHGNSKNEPSKSFHHHSRPPN